MDADQLDGAASVPRGHGGVRAAAHLEHVDCLCVAQRKAARAVGRRAGRLEGAVFVDADQLDGVGSAGGHHGVRAAAHLEHVDVAGAVERVEAARAVGRRTGRLEGAVFVYAYQLDAVVAVRGHHGVPAAAHLERGDASGDAERVEWNGAWRGRRGVAGQGRGSAARRRVCRVAVGGRADRLKGGVFVDANQLDAVVGMPRGHNGVPVAAHLEHVDGVGAVQRVEAAKAVGRRAGRLECAVFVYACQLDVAGTVRRGHGGVRIAVYLKHVDSAGAVQREAADAVGGRAGRLKGAVFVYADKQDAAIEIPRRHHRVRAAAHLERVDIFGAPEHAEAVGSVGSPACRLEGAVLVDAGQQDAAAVADRPDHGGVRVAAHLEHVDGAGAVEPRKAARAAVCRAGRPEGAVLVDADQLEGAVVVPRDNGCVCVSAHLERVDCLYVAHRKAVGTAED